MNYVHYSLKAIKLLPYIHDKTEIIGITFFEVLMLYKLFNELTLFRIFLIVISLFKTIDAGSCNSIILKSIFNHIQNSNENEVTVSNYELTKCLEFTDIIIDHSRTLEQKSKMCKNTSVKCFALSFPSVLSIG